MTIKVHILTQCEQCAGQAMLPIGEQEDHLGRVFTRYAPCPTCEGSGKHSRWIPLAEFAELLQAAVCQHAHVSSQGGLHFSAGDVWDDIVEVCDDCGVKLDA